MNKIGKYSILLLILFISLFVYLRIRWIPHLPAWDEGMNICTVRSFVSAGGDPFSEWFWRHPPLFCLLMALCGPLKTGFATRVEILAVFMGVLSLLVLYLLNRRLFSERAALLSAFFFSILPGCIFYGVWIKRDHGVLLFGLIALLCISCNRLFLAGIALGTALLFKETAVFYLLCAGLFYMAREKRDSWPKGALYLVGLPALLCSWWYIFFAKILVNLKMASSDTSGIWQKEWFYYFRKMPLDLGIPVIVIILAGVLFSIVGKAARNQASWRNLWPVFLVVPAYAVLSTLSGKVPWIVMCMFPAWATIAALAAERATAGVENTAKTTCNSSYSGLAGNITAAIICAVCFIGVYSRDYEDVFRAVDEGQWRGASYSKECADAVNNRVSSGDTLLLTSFYYWKGLAPGSACAVFTSCLEVTPRVLLRPHTMSYQNCLEDIGKYKVNWALLSPEPGQPAESLLGRLIKENDLVPVRLKGAYLFNTSDQ